MTNNSKTERCVQFWYTEETARLVAAEVVEAAGGGSIACLACPSLFRQLQTQFPNVSTHLFEYDPRFEVRSFRRKNGLQLQHYACDWYMISHHSLVL